MRWAVLAFFLACLPAAAPADDSLEDIKLFSLSAGEWEGVGVSFDIVNGELRDPVTFRDRWEAKFEEGGKALEMRGTTQAGGRRIGYVWRFRWQANAQVVTGSFENSEGVASAVEVTAVAEGRRLEIRTPQSEENKGGMQMDIYLEDDDFVIESKILDAEGKPTYRAAARYRRAGE